MSLKFITYLKPFSYSERLKLVLFRTKIYKKTPVLNHLNTSYEVLSQLIKRKVEVKKVRDNVIFWYSVNIKSCKFSLKTNSSDFSVFKQIIIKKEYEAVIHLLEKYNIECKSIIDAGANVGLTTIYFNLFYPNCKIISLEPSMSIFTRLKNNIDINGLKNVICLNKGLWYEKTKLEADTSFRDGQDWSFSLKRADDKLKANIDVLGINDIIRINKIDYIDFLKIDIEGSEKEIIDSNRDTNWLKKVKVIAIEIHDELQCRNQIEKILLDYKFKLSYSGELTIGLNMTLISN